MTSVWLVLPSGARSKIQCSSGPQPEFTPYWIQGVSDELLMIRGTLETQIQEACPGTCYTTIQSDQHLRIGDYKLKYVKKNGEAFLAVPLIC